MPKVTAPGFALINHVARAPAKEKVQMKYCITAKEWLASTAFSGQYPMQYMQLSQAKVQ
jgi:hypothetical protein